MAGLSYGELQAELQRRHQALEALARRRTEVAAELEEIDRELTAQGVTIPGRRGRGRPRKSLIGTPPSGPQRRRGRPPGRRKKAATARKKTTRRRTTRKKAARRAGGRGRNKTNLVEALQKVLSGTTMSVTEVAGAVQKAGYKTSSPNFRTIVNAALIGNPDRFKKVARGQYTAK